MLVIGTLPVKGGGYYRVNQSKRLWFTGVTPIGNTSEVELADLIEMNPQAGDKIAQML
jgi:hypothetical protein